jgi:hypothetical protein
MFRIPKSLGALATAAVVLTAPIALADDADGSGQDPPGYTSTTACSTLVGAVPLDLAAGTVNLVLRVAML